MINEQIAYKRRLTWILVRMALLSLSVLGCSRMLVIFSVERFSVLSYYPHTTHSFVRDKKLGCPVNYLASVWRALI